jgi:alanine dehydrogenase
MLIGIPKEIKNHEYRVGATPASVAEFIKHGHRVIVEKNLGVGIGIADEAYAKAGATVLSTAKEIFEQAEMIIKVKEPQPNECAMLKEGQILFTYLHLASDIEQTQALQKSKCVAIAYETVTSPRGLPLLTPMSEVAGRLAIQVGSYFLLKPNGGSGVLVGGVPGVLPAKVIIIGAGVVGSNSLAMAVGLGADVSILDTNLNRLRELDSIYGNRIKTLYSNESNIMDCISHADLVVSSVLIPGAAAPKVIKKPMLKLMKKGSVIVDVAIDQGGSLETSKVTTHQDPVYEVDGVLHYCVANMPGSVARTSSYALINAVLPYALQIADKGYKKAFADNKDLLNGLNVYKGDITYKAVADDQGKPYKPASF